jgi:hypothetical protein
MRDVNSLGVTGVIDAGGGFQNYPDDYRIIEKLHQDGELTVRISYNLFTQKPKEELADFSGWVKQVSPARATTLPPQRRGRDAGLFGRRLRGLPRRPARHAAQHGRRSRTGDPPAGRTPLALAPPRHL